MFNELGYNSNLEELVNANKADESIAYIIKENIDIQENARKFINITEKEIEELNVTGEGKKSIKMQIPIYNVKDYLSILGEIRSIKKQLKQKTEEVETYNEEIRKAEEQNSEIEKEIEGQYKIYVENEIFTKAVEKMDKSKIDVTSDFYKSYLKHIDDYKNSIYSIEKNSKLPEPKAEDLVAVLNVLKQSENEKKSTEKNTTKKKTVKAEETKKPAAKKAKTTKKPAAKKESFEKRLKKDAEISEHAAV